MQVLENSWIQSYMTNNPYNRQPCYLLIRRYRAGKRISHAPHHAGHLFVTVVVSLSDLGCT